MNWRDYYQREFAALMMWAQTPISHWPPESQLGLIWRRMHERSWLNA